MPTTVELIEPLDETFQNAAPQLAPAAGRRWSGSTPITAAARSARHALFILESLDAIDLAYETFAVTLLIGDLDGEGFPRFDAIVGGPISFWDEASGDLIVRMALCWGGEGVKGDTQRVAQRLLARLMANMLASQGATELGRGRAAGRGHRQQRLGLPALRLPPDRPTCALLSQVRHCA